MLRKRFDKAATKTKIIGLMKHEIDAKITKDFVRIRAKTYSYLTNCKEESKKKRYKKKCKKDTLNLNITKTA